MARKKNKKAKAPDDLQEVDGLHFEELVPPELLEQLQLLMENATPEQILEMFQESMSDEDDIEHEEYDNIIDLPANYEEARELIDALVEEQEQIVRETALEAIRICPECMEAHIVLGELESNTEKLACLYRQASEAGKWMLHNATSIRSSSAAHAYCVYKMQMAEHLWSFGQRVESIEHLMEVKPFDTDSMLGVHVRLAFRLLDIGWDDELNDLLKEWGEQPDSTGYCLLMAVKYYRESEVDKALEALHQTQLNNYTLIDYLLGDEMIPSPTEFEPGFGDDDEEEEAVGLVPLVMPLLRNTPGLVRWIRDSLDYRKPERTPTKNDRKKERDEVLEIPVSDDTWVVDCRMLQDTWVVIIYSKSHEMTVEVETFESRPKSSEAWEVFQEAIRSSSEEPYRPARVALTHDRWLKGWSKKCDQLEIECSVAEADAIPTHVIEDFDSVISRIDSTVEISDELIEDLRTLDMEVITWTVGVYHPPLWITDGATPRQPWIAIVMDVGTGMILMQEIADENSEELILQAVLKAMIQPLGNLAVPHRPSKIQIHANTLSNKLNELLEQLDIEAEAMSMADGVMLDDCVECLVRQVGGSDQPALLDTEGTTIEHMAQLFQSIARFWSIAPWRTIPGDRPIELKSSLFGETNAWYAVIVGQLGMNLGVVLYDRKDAMDAVMMPDGSGGEPDGIFLNYLERFEIPAIDLWMIERHGWKIAAEEAYPLIERALPKLKHRRPNHDELVALDIVLKTLPAFLSRPESDEAFSLTVTSIHDRGDVEVRWA